jgi:UDP-N-acetylmuramyl pentapeptide phosphotransferase/UDP-N-acetylglucosamine-1-phosphate transferase
MHFLFMEKFKILTLFITIVVSGYALKKLLIKYNFLLNYTGYAHQKFTKNTSVPLSGGLLLLVSLIFIDFSLFNYFIIFALLIFFLGLLGDLSYASSAKIRFIVQFFITLSFVYLNDITIPHIRFLPIDRLLEFKIFNYFFTIACLMVLINGTNFIDGCNTLVVGYYLIIGIILHKLNLLYFIFSDSESIYVFFTFLLSIFVLNFFQKLFLGDSGVYILSFIFGTILIKIYQTNTSISPYFIYKVW